MFKISVKNLYIGKSGLNLKYHLKEINGVQLSEYPKISSANLVGDILHEVRGKFDNEPDYEITNCLYIKESNLLILDPVGNYHDTLYVTGIPMESNVEDYIIKGAIYTHIHEDDYRKYLFQITRNV
jgi:hypothetical protein